MTLVSARTRQAIVPWFPILAVAGLVVALVVVHLLWVERFRRGLPLDIDEAGYLGFAFDDLHGWASNGLAGFHDAIVAQRQFGPLVPLTAAPMLGVFGHDEVAGMATQLLYLPVLAFATYGLGSRLAGRWAGALTATVVLLSPGVFDFSRTFHFVVASTTLLTLTVWAVIESDGFRRRGPAMVAGLAAGLLLLSRTYAVVFVPAITIASLLMLARVGRSDRARAALNAGVSAVLAALVAGWWYFPNLDPVFRYLTSYGYGSHSHRYATAPGASPLGLRYWTVRLSQLVSEGLYVVPFISLSAAIVMFAFVRLRTRRDRASRASSSRLSYALDAVATPAGVMTTVLVISYIVLSSSQNRGKGFVVPLAPLFVALAIACVMRVQRVARGVLVGVLLLSVIAIAVGKTTVAGTLAESRCVHLPALDCAVVTDGRGPIQQELAHVHVDATKPNRDRRGLAGAWVRVSDHAARVLRSISERTNVPAVVFFASRDPLFNTNTVGLLWRERYASVLPVGQLRPDEGGDTGANYLRRFVDPQFGQPTFLFTTDRGRYEFPPRVTQPLAERAAQCLGFVETATFGLPDGRAVRLWERLVPLPNPVTKQVLRAITRPCFARPSP